MLDKSKCNHLWTDCAQPARHNVTMSDKQAHFLKEWRVFRGLTQEAAADAAGMVRAYISQLESGKKRHNQDLLDKLAKAYSCEPWELLGKNPLEQNETAQIVDIWDHIPQRNREQARQILETFTEKKA